MKWFNWSELFDDTKLPFGKPKDDDVDAEDEEDDDEEVLDEAAAAATAFKY